MQQLNILGVDILKVEGRWFAVGHDVGKILGYTRPREAFTVHSSEEEYFIDLVKDKDQRRKKMLVSGTAIYELLESMELKPNKSEIEKVERIMNLLFILNDMYFDECEVTGAKLECRNGKIEELNRYRELETIVENKTKVIESKNINIDKLKSEIAALSKEVKDKRIDNLSLIEERDNNSFRVKILIEDIDALENIKEELEKTIGESDNRILELAYDNKDLLESRCPICRLKDKIVGLL